MSLDNLASSTEFPPKEAPRRSVLDRIRFAVEIVMGKTGEPRCVAITMSRQNYDLFEREAGGRWFTMRGPMTFGDMRLKWVAEQADDSCTIEDSRGVFHVLPF